VLVLASEVEEPDACRCRAGEDEWWSVRAGEASEVDGLSDGGLRKLETTERREYCDDGRRRGTVGRGWLSGGVVDGVGDGDGEVDAMPAAVG
jgi:hypothetical protein